jgi:hypothetical protein
MKKLRELSLRGFNNQAITEKENGSRATYNSIKTIEILDLCRC